MFICRPTHPKVPLLYLQVKPDLCKASQRGRGVITEDRMRALAVVSSGHVQNTNIAFLSTWTIDFPPKLLRVASGLQGMDAHARTVVTRSHGDLTLRIKSRHIEGSGCT